MHTVSPFMVKPGLAAHPALVQASSLLSCAMASAYDAADQHSGSARHAGLSVVHMIELAKALVDAALEGELRSEGAMSRLKTT